MAILVFLVIAAPLSLMFGVLIGNIAAAAPRTSRLYKLRQCLLCLGRNRKGICGLNLDQFLFQQRNCFVVCFYWLLFAMSMYSFIKTILGPLTVIIPEKSGEGDAYQWSRALLNLAPYSPNPNKVSIVSRLRMISIPVFNILSATSFALACLLDPGTVRPRKSNTDMINSVDTQEEASNLESDSAYDTFLYPKKTCSTCMVLRPPRSHHCSVCSRCVLDFDHHCIWTNSCIGRNNLLWFNGFLLFTSVALINTALVNALTIYRVLTLPGLPILNLVWSKKISAKFMALWLINSVPIHVLSCLMHGAVGCMLLPFSCFHITNVLRNTRTAERIKRETVVAKLKVGEFTLMVRAPLEKCASLPTNFAKVSPRALCEYAFHFVELIDATYGDTTTIDGVSGRVLTVKESEYVMHKYNKFDQGKLNNLISVLRNGLEFKRNIV
ncbi:Zinc finger domain-containing protein [Giardia lamblia P15]|uniref:Palmitoyltransferase n=1 Tax=Giardia intestinalis (strain P15) TaxID=658858 RepID=E1F6T0_GIAIA|nr:Zinc finger domain-containing protein [Giardia lamblia P15]